MPKAVMISHDNYSFCMDITREKLGDVKTLDGNGRVLTYLPMSHMAAQLVDIVGPLSYGSHVFFPHPSVLQNNMLKYLLIAKP
jgi:long-chain-fatty-acid--CoA ligase ACSBG